MMMCSYSAMSGLDVRRKNATRESTSTLKAWLFQHIKNPYPTKGEKIMLAIVTHMTLTQVTLYCYCYYYYYFVCPAHLGGHRMHLPQVEE